MRPAAALEVLRSRWVRAGFLSLAVGWAVYAVVAQREAVVEAVSRLDAGALAGSAALGVLYIVLTMLSWRAVLADLGSPLGLRTSGSVFFLSQLGKYVPGGVWNVVAAAELASAHAVPRRRSLSAMAVTVLVSIVSGLAVAVAAIGWGPDAVQERYGWVVWTLPLFAGLLVPAVLNRALTGALRLVRRPGLEHPLTARGAGAATGWSVLAWLAAGTHLWLLASSVGLASGARSFALAVGAYALAWVLGFLFVVAPAGLGIREAVLVAALGGDLDSGGVLAVVLVSRVVLTSVDVALGLVGLAATRRAAKEPAS